MKIGFKDNIPNIPIYKLIFENKVLPFLKEHNYNIKYCDIKYEQVDVSKYIVYIRPIEECLEYTIDIEVINNE